MSFTFSDYRRLRDKKHQQEDEGIKKPKKERRPQLTSQEERFLYSLHLKTIEYRTLMATLKEKMSPSEFDNFIVDFNLRLRKAKANFDSTHWKDEWAIINGRLSKDLRGENKEDMDV